jgi:hypothetical protein
MARSGRPSLTDDRPATGLSTGSDTGVPEQVWHHRFTGGLA